MKRKSYKGVKYGAIIVAGMLLMALPMTAMAEKNAEATVVEATTEAKETTKAQETTAETKAEETTKAIVEEETKAEETTKATVEEETKAEETTEAKEETKAEETTAAAEEETKAEEKSTEDATEETTAATEEKTATESKTTETETTAAETTAAEVKSEAKLDAAIIGTWSVDERTSLNFGESSKGKLILPDEDYAFSYKIEGDQLSLDFVSSKATDGTYTASVSGDTLKLIGGKGTIGGTFELSKNK